MPLSQKERLEIFNELAHLMKPYEKGLQVLSNLQGRYELEELSLLQ